MPTGDDRPTGAPPMTPPAAPSFFTPIASEQPGSAIGPYKLLSILGEGGFGVVWLAERREPFVQRVAIKIVKAGMDSKAVLARFEQERQALAMMDHPNVARVHDAGTTALGRPYFVMEFVAGEPITDYCNKHRLTIEQRLELFIPVCEAVQHAHHKGIIHRDLKPSNILVCEHDGHAVPKVIDFGVAKAVSRTLTDKTIFTESGQIIGTPEYMSPEQAEMSGADVDTRSDVYSLGVVLYELLTGELPFASETLRSAGYDGIRRIIREVDPPKPSTRLTGTSDAATTHAQQRRSAPRELAAQLRNELDWIPLKAMRKERTQRYTNPNDLARDIRNYLEGRPLSAGPESAAYRFRKLARRNKGPVAAAGAVAAALVLGVIGFAWQAHRIGIQRDAAVAAQQATELARAAEARERKKSEAINDFIQTALKSSDPNQGGKHDILVSDAMLAAVRQLNDAAFKDQPETEIALRYTIAQIFDGNSRSSEALALADRGLEVARHLHPPPADHIDVARGLAVVGSCLHTLGRDGDALPKFQEALEMSQRLFNNDQPQIAEGLSNVAGCLVSLGRYPEALPKNQTSAEMYQRLYPGDHPLVATSLIDWAYCLQKMDRSAEALPKYDAALAMYQRLHTGDHADIARGLNNVAFCLQSLGKSAEALPKHQAALEMRQRLFKGDHPLTSHSLNNVASCLHSMGRLADALPMYQAALDMQKRLFSGDHPEVAQDLNNVAVCLHTMGRLDDALPNFEAALAMQQRLFKGDHPDIATSMNNVGRVLFLLKRPAEAEPTLRDALAMYRRLNTPEQSSIANVLANLAACLSALNKPGEALDLAQQGASMAARILPEGNGIRKKCNDTLAAIRKKAAESADAGAEPGGKN